MFHPICQHLDCIYQYCLCAKDILENGSAYKKFVRICEAQGGLKEPKLAPFKYDVFSKKSGTITCIDNRKLARIAKLAGAPKCLSAGVAFFAPLKKIVKEGDLLFTIYAESVGELAYATSYLETLTDLIQIE